MASYDFRWPRRTKGSVAEEENRVIPKRENNSSSSSDHQPKCTLADPLCHFMIFMLPNCQVYTASEELAKSEVGNKEGRAIVNKINCDNLIMLSETCCSLEATNEHTNSNEFKPDASRMQQQTEEVYYAAVDQAAKIRKLDKLPIRSVKKVALKNIQKDLSDQCLGLAAHKTCSSRRSTDKLPIRSLKKVALKNTQKDLIDQCLGLAAHKTCSSRISTDNLPIRGEQKVASLKHLFDVETDMHNQHANLNAFLKGSNVQASATNSNTSSHLQMGLTSGSTSTPESVVTAGTLRKQTGLLNYKEDNKDGDWSELEVEALWNLVKKYGAGNWNAIMGDPDLQILRGKTEKHLTEKWNMETFKMSLSAPNRSVLLPVTENTSKHHASQGNGSLFSNFPIHMPRHGIHPFHVGVRNEGLNLGSRIMPSSSNHIFDPYHHEGSSSSSAFHSFQPLAGAHMRQANVNFNTMTSPLSLSATRVSPPSNVETEAQPQFLLCGVVPLQNIVTLNKNAGHDAGNTK